MVTVLRLMKALAALARGIGVAANGLANLISATSIAVWVYASEADIEAFKKWLRGTPQERQQMMREAPPLTPEEQALLAEFQRIMDTRREVEVLSKYVLTLPALPDEGY